ncbi:polyprenyl diphosphate synthase [Kitasatospora sp. NPDC089797]|uniref:polyprenyl diphosphate synthase n=1 Tax=Kitasatospora sp. NPDC089797 TaxID=3155298 RepID=UPI0034128E3F
MRLRRRRPAPRHVALVLDGNRRWARRKHLPKVTEGHWVGFRRIPDVLRWCDQAGIEVVTLWMLSTDNLRRDPEEVAIVMNVICAVVRSLAFQDRWTIRHLGTTTGLTSEVRAVLECAERETCGPGRVMTVNLAICYGGRQEIVSAVRAVLARTVAERGISAHEAVEHLTPEQITAEITAGQPPPDLVVRTSGEHRSSGFLLWTGTHARWWFTSTLWPEFTRRHLHRAISDYRKAPL